VSWLAFSLALWVGLGLELGVRDALRLGTGPVGPSFVVPIVVYFALNASHRPALWGALIAGAMLDLTATMARTDGGDAVFLGPRALGLLLAARLVIAVRTKVIRKSPISMGIASGLAAAVMAVVVVIAFSLRSAIGDPIAWDWGGELTAHVCSGRSTPRSSAFFLAIPLRWVDPVFGFPADRARRFG
jgi:cell shape-determining protein MreD